MTKFKIILLASIFFSIVFPAFLTHAKPFCALRDPVHDVYTLLPTATSYKSIVHSVDKKARGEILNILPFTIHNKEIGKHTLYVGLSGETPLGVVHVRSEPGTWGLLEIAWALDLYGKIIDFRFQRCREDSCDEIKNDRFRNQIVGLGINELSTLINKDGSELQSGKLESISEDAAKLAVSVIRSAMKTIVVTDMIWGEDIKTLIESSINN